MINGGFYLFCRRNKITKLSLEEKKKKGWYLDFFSLFSSYSPTLEGKFENSKISRPFLFLLHHHFLLGRWSLRFWGIDERVSRTFTNSLSLNHFRMLKFFLLVSCDLEVGGFRWDLFPPLPHIYLGMSIESTLNYYIWICCLDFSYRFCFNSYVSGHLEEFVYKALSFFLLLLHAAIKGFGGTYDSSNTFCIR